jgi:hypothetical protein
MRLCTGVFSFVVLTTAAACGDGAPATTPAAATTPGPTFSKVYDKVLAPRGCVTSYCHYLVAGPPALGAVRNAYDHLVGFPSTETDCGGAIRVVPGAPEQSLLFLKVSMAQPPCGNRMPNLRTPLDAAELELIRTWIEGGAVE